MYVYDKCANAGNEINEDSEGKLTGNFAQYCGSDATRRFDVIYVMLSPAMHLLQTMGLQFLFPLFYYYYFPVLPLFSPKSYRTSPLPWSSASHML